MKRLILIAFILITTLSSAIYAQKYNTAIGLRLGIPYGGITGKYFFSKKSAVDCIINMFGGGYGVTALYEIHKPLKEIKGLDLFYGAGLHVGSWSKHVLYNGNFPNDIYRTAIGFDATIGIEYTLKDFPICISMDLKPYWDLKDNPDLSLGLSLRYVL